MKNSIMIIVLISMILLVGCTSLFQSNPAKEANATSLIHITHAIKTSKPTVTLQSTPSAVPTVMQTATPTVIPTTRPTTPPISDQLLSGMKICIDPGHQIKGNYEKELCAPWSDTLKSKCTSGTCGNFVGTDEYVINLQISLILRDKLVALGADVLMTREIHEVDISNKERAEKANQYGADITLRIHCNSADSAAAEGIDLYIRDVGDGSTEYKQKSDKDYAIAKEMLEYICNATSGKKRNVNRSDAYTGINWCENTCVIVECGFMSNEKEDRLLNTADYQDKIAQGIVDYFISTRQ